MTLIHILWGVFLTFLTGWGCICKRIKWRQRPLYSLVLKRMGSLCRLCNESHTCTVNSGGFSCGSPNANLYFPFPDWGNKSRPGKPYLESFGVRRPIQRPSRSSLIPQGEVLPIDSGFAGVPFRYFGRYSWFWAWGSAFYASRRVCVSFILDRFFWCNNGWIAMGSAVRLGNSHF